MNDSHGHPENAQNRALPIAAAGDAARRPSRWRTALATAIPVLWYVIAAALIFWASFYLVLHLLADKNALSVAFAYFVFFVLFFVVMFYGEGTEVAVAMLIDKDPEQVPLAIRPGFVALQKSNQVLFISGRQLIVVFAIVGMTFLCLKLADVQIANTEQLPRIVAVLLSKPAVDTFTILFPTFFALWFIQLPPKFIAHENPLTTYSWQLTRAAIACSIFLGKTLRVEGPSTHVKALLMRLQPTGGGSLRPSRENYYETSATLRDGKAIESADIDIFVAHNGAVRVIETFRFRAFAKGFKKIPQWSGWEAEIKRETAKLVVTDYNGPGDCVVSAPKLKGPTIEADGKNIYSVEWFIKLKENLPVGSTLAFVAKYSTESSAAEVRPGKTDFFEYDVSRVPTADLTLKVQPEAGAPFSFFEREVAVDTSEDRSVNEAEKINFTRSDPYGPRGYIFRARYPLLSTKLRFTWTVDSAEPAPPPLESSLTELVSAPNVSYADTSGGEDETKSSRPGSVDDQPPSKG